MSDRWQLGDVILWVETGAEEHAQADADVHFKFYTADGSLIGWVRAFERADRGGFEVGETNCGYLGHLDQQLWLRRLLEEGHLLGIRVEAAEGDHPDWFVDGVSVDFRVGPVSTAGKMKAWSVNEWIVAGAPEVRFEMDPLVSEGEVPFSEVGFDKELEIECGVTPV